MDADDYFAPDYVRLAARVLDENEHIGMVYAYGCLTGEREGQWLEPCSQQELIFNEGAPAPSMFRKKIWQKVGGYHDYMHYGREDWDFFLSVLEQGYGVHALEETVGIYYRIKKESRSALAGKHEISLLKNIYEHHKALFLSEPKDVARMFHRCYLLRRYYKSEEFTLGYRIVKPIAQIRDFIQNALKWIKIKRVKENT